MTRRVFLRRFVPRGHKCPPYALLACLLSAAALAAAPGRDAQQLITGINQLRAAPAAGCAGQRVAPAPPLAPQQALSELQVKAGSFVELLLEQRGFPVDRAQVIEVNGAPDAAAALNAIRERYCRVLLSRDFSAIGARRNGDAWQIVLAQPYVKPALPDWPEAGHAILAAINQARASARMCGERLYPAVAPVAWNDQLAAAALRHSQDMALHHFFEHRGSDGSSAAERVTRAGYAWRRVGENIASGQNSPEEAVAGWLDSPGHCGNLMTAAFTDMGAAYFVSPDSKTGRIYWTQDFAARR
jgi:uncharacterized protein YkwD